MAVAPNLSVEPQSAMVGNQVSLSGKGFTADSKVLIKFDNIPILSEPLQISQDGTFVRKFRIPLDSQEGTHDATLLS